MRKHSTHSRMFEILENRCLLSVTPAVTTALPVSTSAVTVAPATTSVPRLVGSYTGSVTLGMPNGSMKMKFNATWVVKTQAAKSLTGTINIDGIIGTGTFTGTIDSKGNFKYTVPVHVGRIQEVMTIAGHISGKTATGTITLARGTTVILTGPFTFTRK